MLLCPITLVLFHLFEYGFLPNVAGGDVRVHQRSLCRNLLYSIVDDYGVLRTEF